MGGCGLRAVLYPHHHRQSPSNMAEFSKKHPQLAAELQGLIESGMNPDQLIEHFRQQDERKRAEEEEPTAPERFPEEIKLIAQAFAYRKPDSSDVKDIHALLNAAYMDELKGPEAFRESSSQEAVSLDTIQCLFLDASYQWLVMENPAAGGSVFDADSSSLIGACCYSTDGVSRRNGEVEGSLGSIRFFGILPNYRGLCVGQRLLGKVEDLMFNKGNCCRAMVCLPSARVELLAWVQRRNYLLVGSSSYPARSIGQVLKDNRSDVELVRLIKSKPSLHSKNNIADDKEKKVFALATTVKQGRSIATTVSQTATGPVLDDMSASEDKTPVPTKPCPVKNSHLPPM